MFREKLNHRRWLVARTGGRVAPLPCTVAQLPRACASRFDQAPTVACSESHHDGKSFSLAPRSACAAVATTRHERWGFLIRADGSRFGANPSGGEPAASPFAPQKSIRSRRDEA